MHGASPNDNVKEPCRAHQPKLHQGSTSKAIITSIGVCMASISLIAMLGARGGDTRDGGSDRGPSGLGMDFGGLHIGDELVWDLSQDFFGKLSLAHDDVVRVLKVPEGNKLQRWKGERGRDIGVSNG